MDMFLSRVIGVADETDFSSKCAQILLPGLAENRITASAWVAGQEFYLHGFHDEDPSGVLEAVAAEAECKTETTFLRTLISIVPGWRNPVGLPGGRTIDCEMPHNNHEIKGESFKTCRSGGHKITDNHDVIYCPVCSDLLA
jgi:hypothetical protein